MAASFSATVWKEHRRISDDGGGWGLAQELQQEFG
jgi:hypothetical protein